MRILVVDDEVDLLDAVARGLRREGYAVDTAEGGSEAIEKATFIPYDLICLDLTMPGIDGLEVCSTLRADPPGEVPPRILMLTARDTVEDRIRGLDVGADDYLVKPFDLDELRARVAAVSRRYAGNPNPTLRLGDLEIDKVARRIRRGDEEIELTRREWAVLDLLTQRPGAIVSKDRLEEALYDFEAEVESNTVEVHISRLRKKLGRDTIRTLRGVGYRVEAS